MFRRPDAQWSCSILSKGNSARCPSRFGSSKILEQDLQAITVVHLPPKVYTGGFINFEHSFSEPGKFIGIITVGGKEEHAARFPISVGTGGGTSHLMHYMMVIVPVAVFFGGGVIFLILRGRRKSPVTTVS
jgi:hypothetical protein